MISLEQGFQGPIDASSIAKGAARLRICSHPAFRLGFLDAQNGRPFDHDEILRRIKQETPAASLERTGWDADGRLFNEKDIERAQFRYEEGRLLVIKYGLRCHSWTRPEYLPKAVRNFAVNRPDDEPL